MNLLDNISSYSKDGPLFTVAIATRNDGKGLWFTLQSVILETLNTQYAGRFGFAVVNNSDRPEEKEYIRSLCAKFMSSAFRMKYVEEDYLSNHRARNAAVKLSETPYTVMCDSHVLFGRGFFDATVGLLEQRPDIGLVHTPFSTMGISDSERLSCFYNLTKFDSNFHGPFSRYGAVWDKPFPIAIAPHAAVAFRTAQWLDYGGYIDDCEGHGGGEPFVTFKYWLFGSSVYVNPASVYAHWRHASYRKSKPGWLKNMTTTAYALWGKDIGDRYAERLRSAHVKDVLWQRAEPYHQFVQSRTAVKYEDFLELLKAKKARPVSREPL